MEEAELNVQVYGCTDIGKLRTRNEDSFVVADLSTPSQPIHTMSQPTELAVRSRGVLLAVSDGMGGARAGEVASALTLHSLRKELRHAETSDAERALVASVEQANTDVWTAAASAERKGMGATLTAVLIHGARAYVAEIGDSRAYLLRGQQIVQLTHDQSCVQLLLDAGTLTREQAETFPYKHIIMQAIGTKPNVVVALNRVALCQGDRLLLCSDGLTNKATDEELRTLITYSRLDVACSGLVELANVRGGDDNVTVVLAEMTGRGFARLPGHDRIALETLQEFAP
ncbi:MAG: protein phosphatase 2C domain-containing protein [Polyangiales bacterium]